MPTGTLLESVVYAFRDLFGSQNSALFSAYVWGVLPCESRHTVSVIYLPVSRKADIGRCSSFSAAASGTR